MTRTPDMSGMSKMVAQIEREVKGLDNPRRVCYTPRVLPSQHVHLSGKVGPVDPVFVYGYNILLELLTIC